MKSWLTSKTVWLNGLVFIASVAALGLGFMPAEYAGYALAGITVLNLGLRVVTKGKLSIALPANVPAIPPVLQAAINAFEQVAAALPPEFGPRVLELVETAARADFAANEGRFDYVLSELQTEFPDLGTNVLRAAIEDLVLAKNQGAALPPVIAWPMPPVVPPKETVPPLCTGCGPEVTADVKPATTFKTIDRRDDAGPTEA